MDDPDHHPRHEATLNTSDNVVHGTCQARPSIVTDSGRKDNDPIDKQREQSLITEERLYDGGLMQENPEFDEDLWPGEGDDDDEDDGTVVALDADANTISTSCTLRKTSKRLFNTREADGQTELPIKRQKFRSDTSTNDDLDYDIRSRPDEVQSFPNSQFKLQDHLWRNIFTYLDASSLARLRCAAKLFSTMLNDENIWRKSRKVHGKDMPKPAFGLKEWEMWSLWKGRGCMSGENCVGTVMSSTHTKVYWPFRVRCCGECFRRGVFREEEIISCEGNIPKDVMQYLLVALPYGVIDQEDKWISRGSMRESSSVCHRIFWAQDVENIKERFLDAKLMGASEEWLKGLESEGQHQRSDMDRMERWNAKQQTTSLSKVEEYLSSYVLPMEASVLAPGTKSAKEMDTVARTTAMKVERRNTIIARCARLTPPITEKALIDCPVFQAAVEIAQPLTETAWKLLLPKLLSQATSFDSSNGQHQDQIDMVTHMPNGRKTREIKTVEAATDQPKIGSDGQSIVRDSLSRIADALILSWSQEINEKSVSLFAAHILIHTREKYYQQFDTSMKLPKESLQNDSMNLDASLPKLVLEHMKFVFDTKVKPRTDSFRKELFLCHGCGATNPKLYGFEGIIQHYAAKHTTLMSMGTVVVHWQAEWPSTPPFYADPSTVPKVPRYLKSNRNKFIQMPAAGLNSHFINIGPSPLVHNPAYPSLPGQNGFPLALSSFPHPNQQFIMPEAHAHQFTNFTPQFSTSNSPVRIGRSSIMSPIPMHNTSLPSQFHLSPHRGHHNMPHNALAQAPSNIIYSTQNTTFTAPPIVQYSHNAHSHTKIPSKTSVVQDETKPKKLISLCYSATLHWDKLNDCKDLPVSVRVFVMINEVADAFKNEYSQDLPVQLFHEALREQSDMKSLRTVCKLQCYMCPSTSKRDFSLPLLFQHFESVHIRRPYVSKNVEEEKSRKPNWLLGMVKLPDRAQLETLQEKPHFNEHKFLSLTRIYPDLFQNSASSRLKASKANFHKTTKHGEQALQANCPNASTEAAFALNHQNHTVHQPHMQRIDKENIEPSSKFGSSSSLVAAEDFLKSLIDTRSTDSHYKDARPLVLGESSQSKSNQNSPTKNTNNDKESEEFKNSKIPVLKPEIRAGYNSVQEVTKIGIQAKYIHDPMEKSRPSNEYKVPAIKLQTFREPNTKRNGGHLLLKSKEYKECTTDRGHDIEDSSYHENAIEKGTNIRQRAIHSSEATVARHIDRDDPQSLSRVPIGRPQAAGSEMESISLHHRSYSDSLYPCEPSKSSSNGNLPVEYTERRRFYIGSSPERRLNNIDDREIYERTYLQRHRGFIHDHAYARDHLSPYELERDHRIYTHHEYPTRGDRYYIDPRDISSSRIPNRRYESQEYRKRDARSRSPPSPSHILYSPLSHYVPTRRNYPPTPERLPRVSSPTHEGMRQRRRSQSPSYRARAVEYRERPCDNSPRRYHDRYEYDHDRAGREVYISRDLKNRSRSRERDDDRVGRRHREW